MAAFTRHRARSASRRSESLDELPPTVIQQNPSDNTRLGKRSRDSSVKANESRSIKKQRLQVENSTPSRDASRNPVAKPATASGTLVVRDAGTQIERPPNPGIVQLRGSNGSTVTSIPNNSGIDAVNGTRPQGLEETSKQGERRTLRSQAGGSRSKSELSWYFSNYDELVNDEPREPGNHTSTGLPSMTTTLICLEFLTPDTRIQIVDEPIKASTRGLLNTAPTIHALSKLQPSSNSDSTIPNGPQQAEKEQMALNGAKRVALPTLDHNSGQDPLGDDIYAKAHRRAERQEKQLRNIEKERAMHEKVQLERLLDNLKGHDWLKVMGISGVTDGDKKSWEPKRDYFIREVEILLEKFREWKEEEKRRKTEREERLLAEEEEEKDEDSQVMSDDGPPDDSDVDACAARQLHREAGSATVRQPRSRKYAPKYAEPPPVQKPFTSFYDKQHLREAALGKHRRGRTRLAFGQPLPDPTEREFGLPQDILTLDALRASARSRRAARRESKA